MEGGHVDDVRLVEVSQLDVAVAEVEEPGEFPPGELLSVEGFVAGDGFLQFLGDVERRDGRLVQGPGTLLEYPDEVVDPNLERSQAKRWNF